MATITGFTMMKACFVSFICEAFLHGIYTVLCGAALYLLINKRRSQIKKRTNLMMITVTLVMYLSATTHLLLSLYQNYFAIFNENAAQSDGLRTLVNDFHDPTTYSQIALELINCVLGDLIVIWRTWVIWGKDSRAILFPAICGLGATASGIGLVHSLTVAQQYQPIYDTDAIIWFESFGGFTCASNIYAVAAISYRTWQTIQLHRALGTGFIFGGGSYFGVLLILIESGTVYCFALVIAIILFSTGSNGVYIITDTLGQLTGIYPTLIIVLVCLKLSWENNMPSSTLPTSMIQHTQAPNAGTSLRRFRSRVFGDVDSEHNPAQSQSRCIPSIKIQTVTVQEVWEDRSNESVLDICKDKPEPQSEDDTAKTFHRMPIPDDGCLAKPCKE